MAEGERATGTPNTIYDLSSVLFHALEGGASYDTFIEDAEREGDQELAGFFRQVRDEDSDRADWAQELLAERTHTAGRMGATATPMEGATPGVLPGTEPIDAPPGGEEALPPRAEEVPPRMGEVPPMTEGRPLGTEGILPPRPEEVSPRAGEAPLPEEQERARREEREQGDKSLIDRARDALRGE